MNNIFYDDNSDFDIEKVENFNDILQNNLWIRYEGTFEKSSKCEF